MKLLRAVVLCATAVGIFGGTARAQIHADYEPLPVPLEKAVSAGAIIVRAQAAAIRNESYRLPVGGGRFQQKPVTVLVLRVTEVMKGASRVKLVAGQLEVRRLGYSVDDSSDPEMRKGVDLDYPRLVTGTEYVLFIEPNQVGEFWLWGPQGVFEERDGKVGPPPGSGPSRITLDWQGRPWNEFLQAIRSAAAKTAGRGPR